MDEIRIGFPRMIQTDNGNIRLVADIALTDGAVRELWFQTDAMNADSVVHERADAFLVGLIPFIARNGGRVVCDAPVSGHLLHNLRHLLSPVLPSFHPGFTPLDIVAESNETDFRTVGTPGVETGCSCGIDSMATLAVYAKPGTPSSLRVNTLAFFDVGSHGSAGKDAGPSDDVIALAAQRRKNVFAFSDAMGLPIIRMESNISEFNAGLSHVHLHTFRNISAVLVFQKHFSAYHYASGFPITHFRITIDGLSHADEFLLRCLSTESTRLYSSLAALTRQERTAIVADYGPAKEFLNVCVKDARNCGFCFKCARTMFQLDLIGKLDEFGSVFDVDAYRKNRRRILKLIAKDTHFHDEYLAAAANSHDCPYSGLRLNIAFASGRISQSIVRVRKRLTGKKTVI